jgi:hypothetical protein
MAIDTMKFVDIVQKKLLIKNISTFKKSTLLRLQRQIRIITSCIQRLHFKLRQLLDRIGLYSIIRLFNTVLKLY